MNKNKSVIRIVFILLLFITHSILAQNTDREFLGSVTGNRNPKEPLAGVICKAFDANNKMLRFKLSNDNGHFALKDEGCRFSYITFDYLGYKAKRIEVESINDIRNIKIQLEETDVNLKEITVTAQPIQQTNDTIRYNVGSFQGQEDRYLADVLKKLPGIQVSENGTITYQGEAINKFYIEGHDLVGGQYGVVTNNLSADAISQIQVLERNQPIKVLKGVTPSDKAGINIKLKNTFLFKPFGEVKAGIGYSPLLYDGKIFATQIGAKVQSLVNLKMNNTGVSLENELKDKLTASNAFFNSFLPENLISHDAMQNLPVDADRYLFNKSGIGSVNSLVALAKETELRISLSYLKDRQSQDFNLRQTFATGSDPVIVEEFSRQINKTENLQISALLEHNASRNYFKNELKSTFRNANNQATLSRVLYDTETANGAKPVILRNDLQGVIKYGNNHVINLSSLLHYSNNKESLSLTQADDSLLSETARGTYFQSKNRLYTSFSVANRKLGAELNLNYESKDLDGQLPLLNMPGFSSETGLFVNAFKTKTDLLYSDLTLSYQIISGSNLNTTITVPFVLYNYNIRNVANESVKDSKTGITPSISNRFKINHQWETNFSAGYDFDYGNPFISLIDNPFFRNHRQFYLPSGIIGERQGFHVNNNLKLTNLVNMFFINFTVMYRKHTTNHISRSYNTSNWSYLTTEKMDNTGSQFISLVNLSKSFIPIGLAVTLTPEYTQMRSMQIQQDNLFQNRSNIVALTLKLDSKYFKKFTATYLAKGQTVWNDNKLMDRVVLKNLQHRMVLWYFPRKNFDLSLNSEHNLLERTKDKYDSYLFMDFRSHYLLKKTELEFSINNIFNNNYYSVTNLSGANSTFREFPLRGREFLLSTKFSF